MASWQPPIPSGALYSKSARALGPALPLLAYCYDLVQRDGWFDLNLKDAAGDMEEAYPTIKRWWQTITTGPFFAEIQNHGRKGMRVRFKDIWLDWRILKTRTPAPDEPSVNGTETGSEMIPNNTQEANRDTIGIIIGTETGSEMIPEQSGNKVLMITDQADLAHSPSANGAQPIRKPKTKDCTPEHQAYLDRKKAIEAAYVAELGYKPGAFAKEAKFAKELAELGYTPEQVIGCYRFLYEREDGFYRKQHISLGAIRNQIGAYLKMKKPQAPPTKHAIVPDSPPIPNHTPRSGADIRAALARIKNGTRDDTP